MENQSKDPPFEADYETLTNATGFSLRQVQSSCRRLVQIDGFLKRVHLSPFGRRGRSRLVFRIPYGNFYAIREIVNEGDKATPFIISSIRKTHNPMSRSDLSSILHLPMRSTQRRLQTLVESKQLKRVTVKEWTRKGWVKRTKYKLTSGAKHKPLTEWMENHEQWKNN
jgi:hypothetical protein